MMRQDEMSPGLGAPTSRRSLALRAADLALPALIVLIALVAGAIEPRFFSLGNLTSLAKQIVPLMIASVGQAFAIISGGLDLSLAAVMSLAGVVGVLSMGSHGVLFGVAVMALTGVVAGLASGFVIAYFNTTPLIVTLGMMWIAQAIALILANGVPIYSIPEGFSDAVGFGQIYGVPVTVLIGAATMLVGAFLLRKTVFGRYVYAIGSNRSRSRP